MTHFLQRTALIALATGALGACSTTDTEGAFRPNFPVRAPETPPSPPQAAAPAPLPAPLPPADAPVTVAPAPPVQQRALEPLAPAAPPAPRPPIAQPTPRPAPPPQPTYRTVTTRSVTGRVVDVPGRAATYTVKKGDNLEKIAGRLDTTVAQLREDNDIGRREAIQPGQKLKGPATTAKAYVTGQGDTLFSIGKRFGVTAEALREENDLPRNATLRAGQRIRLPEGYRDRGPLTSSERVLVRPATPTPAPLREPQSEAPTEVEEAPPSQAPRAPSSQAPSYRTVTTRSVTGRVVEVEGPAVTYTVKKGDNLEKIADRLDTTVAQLREDNEIGRREAIQPGQKLKGPRRSAKAYVAGQGDTLFSIAKRFSVTAEALREENDLSRNASIRAGQRIRLPEGYRDRGPISTTTRVPVTPPPAPRPQPAPVQPAPAQPPAYQTAPSPPPARPLPAQPAPRPAPLPTPAPAPAPRPYTPPPVRPAPPAPRPYTPPPRTYTPAPPQGPVAVPTSAPTPGDAQISELGRGRFVWPLQGSIISDFGPKGPGQRNDGINIGAPVGTSVRAAASGDVVYAGDQVPGFGNLVLIKHADGWVTAYGHLSRVLVRMQQKVTQGQEIGATGATGGVAEPQLHFEVRYAPNPLERAKPIDPKLVLPR